MAEAEEVIVEEVVEGVGEAHSVDEEVEEGEEEEEEEVRSKTGMIVLESNLTLSDVKVWLYILETSKSKNRNCVSLFIC